MPAQLVLHSVPEALARLGVGRTTLYELIGDGEIETVHIGRRMFVPSDSVDAFIERNRSVAGGSDDAA